MKNWEFGKVTGSEIEIDERLSDMMGIVEGGCVYSTLFEYNDDGPKKYEVILSMYPQENYRTLTNITLYMKDVPGSSAQGAHFLGDRGINILNSISLDGISDTIIIWKALADLSFAGEMDILLGFTHRSHRDEARGHRKGLPHRCREEQDRAQARSTRHTEERKVRHVSGVR